jgi:cysteine desulfurase
MKKRIYLDYAATTPIDRRVFAAMLPYFADEFGNPSNLYDLGLKAKRALAEAARKITDALNCTPDEFIFTGSATEADNLAILGVARANKERGNKIIVSNVEHKGILAVCEALKKEGFEIVELRVGKNGLINPAELAKSLDERTVLVSVTCADSETGTIQPISEISRILRRFRDRVNGTGIREKEKSSLSISPYPCPFFHSDASQAALYLDLDVEKLGVDLMTLSAHKLYGPKGIGGLYVRRGTAIEPIIFGGGQQRRLRSGTENVPAIVGFGAAMKLATSDKRQATRKAKKLRDKLEAGIFKKIPKVVLNGNKAHRLPNFLNISILDIEGEAMLLYLDEKGILVNTGSACNSESLEPSYVLTALGNPYEYIHGSIRFTLGKKTTASDINYVLRELPPLVEKLRQISPLNLKPGAKEKMSLPKAFIGGQTPHFLRKRK